MQDALRRTAFVALAAWLGTLSHAAAEAARPQCGADPEVSIPDGFCQEVVASGLELPTDMAFLPDGRMMVAEQFSGFVRLVLDDRIGAIDPILSLPDVNVCCGERGLLGLAIDPAWPQRPYVYLIYTRQPEGHSAIVRYTARGDLTDSGSDQLVLDSPYEILDDIPDASGVPCT